MIRAPARRADLISSSSWASTSALIPRLSHKWIPVRSVSVSRRAQIKRTAEAPDDLRLENLIGINGKILAKQRNRDVPADFFQIFIAS